MKFKDLKQFIQSDLVTLKIVIEVEKYGETWEEKRFWDSKSSLREIFNNHQYDEYFVDGISSEIYSYDDTNGCFYCQPVQVVCLVPQDKYDEYSKNLKYFINSGDIKNEKDL